MSVYNADQYLSSCIESIFDQSYQNWELIVINDHSNDLTSDILEQFKDRDDRLYIYHLSSNSGQTLSLNYGISLCKGYYIARIDADDIMMPERIKKQVDFLELNPDYGLCGSYAILIDEHSQPYASYTLPTTNEKIKNSLKKFNPIMHPTVLIRKELLIKSGGYDISYHAAQDYKLWIILSKYTKMANLPEFLLQYRVLSNSISRKNKTQIFDTIILKLETMFNGFLPYDTAFYCLKDIVLYSLPSSLLSLVHRLRITRDKKKGTYNQAG